MIFLNHACKERSFRPLLTQGGDVPDARLERTNRGQQALKEKQLKVLRIRPLFVLSLQGEGTSPTFGRRGQIVLSLG